MYDTTLRGRLCSRGRGCRSRRSDCGDQRLPRGGRVDAHALALAAQRLLEFDVAVDQGVKGVVPAHADVDARLPLRAALADDDAAGAQVLAAELLDAEALRLAVASVARRA